MVKIYTPPYFSNQELIAQRIDRLKGNYPQLKPVVMQPYYYGIPANPDHYLLSLAPAKIQLSIGKLLA